MFNLVSQFEAHGVQISLPKKFADYTQNKKDEIIHILDMEDYKKYEQIGNKDRIKLLSNNLN